MVGHINSSVNSHLSNNAEIHFQTHFDNDDVAH